MPKLKDDITTTWSLVTGDLTWTVEKNVKIDTTDDNGITDVTGNNEIRVLGSVLGDDGVIGIDYRAGSTVFIGKEGWISGFNTGIQTGEMGGTVINRGRIDAATGLFGQDGVVVNEGSIVASGPIGIAINYTARVGLQNDGLLSGEHGVLVNGGTILNGADGRITATGTAVELLDTVGQNTMENKGIIRSPSDAIISNAQTTVTNHGTIFGDIVLSDFDDRVDTRDGVVKGVLRGGEGDDTYLVSDEDQEIVDSGASFFDVVKSTVSYRLFNGLDELHLLGKKNIDGLGFLFDDVLIGNRGKNVLTGADGDDILDGGRGNDTLLGNMGNDEFRFGKGSGTDTLADFEDGMDIINCAHVQTPGAFNRLDIDQRGKDVVIDFGRGDKLIIENVDKQDIDVNDFMMPI